ncbi:MAG: flavin reductase family protein [Sedimentisphaerales bacterium]|nr:flavin reductase family protein [Sedimentisphaerales bacterium]
MKVEANKKNALAVMPRMVVSVRDKDGHDNALVVAYGGNCSYDPPMIMVGIVPSRYSYHMIKENGCFVAHLLDASQKKLYECCGTKSGKDGDKLKEYGIKLVSGKKVNAGVIEECPVAIECTVVDSIMTGSHEMFIGKVEYVHADKDILTVDGKVDLSKLNLI